MKNVIKFAVYGLRNDFRCEGNVTEIWFNGFKKWCVVLRGWK